MTTDKNILEKLNGLLPRYEEVSTLITDSSVIANQPRYVKLTKEYKDLDKLMKMREAYIHCLEEWNETKQILIKEQDLQCCQLAVLMASRFGIAIIWCSTELLNIT